MSPTTTAVVSSYARHLPLAERACAFLTSATDPFHAVRAAITKLESAGFTRVQNKSFQSQSIEKGGKYYYTVHHSTLVAFTVGKQYEAGKGGFLIIGGHTDSPTLKVKPKTKKTPKAGTIQLGVECYGGGLWHTFFDRDLSISGKVLVRDADSKIRHKLVQLKDPVARVSTLCIHLQSPEERLAFKVNKEDHTSPIIGMEQAKPSESGSEELEQEIQEQLTGGVTSNAWLAGQEPLLLTRLAQELGCNVNDIADFELNLYDTQPASIGGLGQEFLYSGRLDNLATVFAAVEAMVDGETMGLVESSTDVNMMCFFDHEEVGSVSSHGAGSPVIEEAVRRLGACFHDTKNDSPDLYADTIAKSFILSIDQAHALHPNYASKHDAQHSPLMNHGVVIKTNSNQRYTTNSTTGFMLREVARKADVPIQEFCVRNDCPCGSTIGPTISALTGIRTVDAGMPQLSMHSCREVMGIADLTHGVELFKGFFRHFREVDDCVVDEQS
ncbi:hypothetical protein MPSEU_000151700 [Mayamaea pseudoterrestris]|nr:hypothetical protein MPSEU_000151700 [Mayamaea pseudoterrestris]